MTVLYCKAQNLQVNYKITNKIYTELKKSKENFDLKNIFNLSLLQHGWLDGSNINISYYPFMSYTGHLYTNKHWVWFTTTKKEKKEEKKDTTSSDTSQQTITRGGNK